MNRRTLLTTGLAATAGVAGLATAQRIASRYGLIPPNASGPFALGETLTYASQRLLTRHSMAREFSRAQISARPFPNELAPPSDEFKRHQAAGFADWKLSVTGLVDSPGAFTLAQIKTYPTHTQITQLACEEGWSYIAEWTGVPLSHILETAGIQPHARFVVYSSIEHDWWDSTDMADALHPQTLVTHRLNGGDLPVANGGPLRLRVPRQLGYKSIKFLNRLIVTDDLKQFGKGLGSASPEGGYSWYAGI